SARPPACTAGRGRRRPARPPCRSRARAPSPTCGDAGGPGARCRSRSAWPPSQPERGERQELLELDLEPPDELDVLRRHVDAGFQQRVTAVPEPLEVDLVGGQAGG